MMTNYTATVILSGLTLCVLSILVHENARLPAAVKRRFYLTYTLVLLATVSEWLGIILNGMPEWTVGLHRIVKCIDYIITPVVGVCFAWQVSDDNEWKRHHWVIVVLILNALLQIVSIFTGWTFYIDETNHYCHGPLYIVYSIFYCIAIVDVLFSFLVYSRSFKKQNKGSIYSIVVLCCTGIALQELGDGSIRTSCLSLALGSLLLFIHYSELQQQRNDERLLRQKALIETDALTGVFSRYSYIMTLNEYHQQDALPQGLAVFSIDINGLKFANDTQGHAAGDRIICKAAKCLKEVFDQDGNCFRVGGDEFIAIVQIEAEHIAEKCKALSAETGNQEGWSLSFGYALAEEHPGLSIEELVNVADKMMYANKEAYYQSRKLDGHSHAAMDRLHPLA